MSIFHQKSDQHCCWFRTPPSWAPRRDARREIFTTPGLVTTRRSTLGPPAEGWPGSSTIKNPNYKYDSLPIAPIYHTFHTVNTISILLLMNQTSEVLLEGKFLSRPIRKYRTVMRISANLRFAPRGRKSQRVFWPKAPHLMRTYLMWLYKALFHSEDNAKWSLTQTPACVSHKLLLTNV